MNGRLTAERRIATWLADEASAVDSAELVANVLDATSRSRPLPKPVAVILEPGVRSPGGVMVGIPRKRLLLLAAVLALGVAAVAGSAVLLLRQAATPDVWSGYRGDASRSGLGGKGPIGGPVTRWQITAGGAISNAIAIADELVLVPTDDGVLHALHVRDGTPGWIFRAAAPVRGAFIHDARVLVTDGDGRIDALDLKSGREIWASAPIDSRPSDLTALGTTLYVGTSRGELVAIDGATGFERWRVRVSPAGRAVHAPAAAAGIVATTSDDNVVTLVEGSSGVLVWQRSADAGGEPIGPPVLAGGTVYIGMAAEAQSGRLLALSVSDGAERWRLDRNVFAPSIAGSVGYTGSGTGRVAALDLRSGGELWVAQYEGAVRAPAIAGNVLYIAADGDRMVAALDRFTGAELWRVPASGANPCCIAVGDGLAVVGSVTGRVEAIGGDGNSSGPGPGLPSESARSTVSPSAPMAATPRSTPQLLKPRVLWTATSGAPDFVPTDLAEAPDGTIWVAEGLADRFSHFTPDGRFIESWGASGTGPGEFLLRRANGDPVGTLAFAPDGSFYVLDVGNFQVDHFSRERAYLGSFGRHGLGRGELSDPVGLAVGPEGSVSVLDDTREVIETFSPDGKVLATIAAFPPEIGPNQGGTRLAIGPTGHFYVGVAFPNEVIELDPAGRLVRLFGQPGSGSGAFADQPGAPAFDRAGHIYITQGLERADSPGVLVFSPDGVYLGGFGPSGGGPGDLAFPDGLLVDTPGIVVGDAGEAPSGHYPPSLRKFEPIAGLP